MRFLSKSGAALLALCGAVLMWLWRNPQARAEARRMLNQIRPNSDGSTRPIGRIVERARTLVGQSVQPVAKIVGQPNDQFSAQSVRPTDEDVAGILNLADENLTVTQRVRTNLGREAALANLPHLNINTEGRGIVYLRGYVHNEEQRRVAEEVARNTEGVSDVVNDLHIEQAVNM